MSISSKGKQAELTEVISNYPKVLAECAIAEQLRRDPAVALHPTLFNTPLIYGPPQAREIMTGLYMQYLEVAGQAQLPLLLTAPTWRLDQRRVTEAGVPESINTDAVAYLRGVRARFGPEFPVLVGALTGPQNDCYRADLAPPAEAAQEFHTPQIQELAATPADFLQAQTLPAVGEALGVARAMAATGRPYIISFCTAKDGRVLDGTPLPEAMSAVDSGTATPPVGYYVNCTHPQFLLDAYSGTSLSRLIGIQANASSKDVTSLDGSAQTETDSLPEWTAAMLRLHEEHEVSVLGGCCGTSVAHLRALAGLL